MLPDAAPPNPGEPPPVAPTLDPQPAPATGPEPPLVEHAVGSEEPPVAPEPAPSGGAVAGGGGRRPRRSLVLGLALVLVAVLGGSGLFVSGYVLGQRQALQPGTPATDAAAFQPFWDVYAAIRDRFALGPIDQQTLVEGAIKGMVGSLGDPYSTYLTADEFRATLQGISGQFEGIGAEIGTVDANGAMTDCSTFGPDCRLAIVKPIAGSPAAKADLRPGDVIVKVDGTPLAGMSLDQAQSRIRGKKGTQVVLTIDRSGVAPFDVTITRDVVQQQEVATKDLANGTISYISLAGFSDAGTATFVDDLKAAIARGQTKFIIDLRGNPGGFVNDARTIASQFIKSGPIFWEQDAQGKVTATDTLGDGVATGADIQVAVLIDKGSASASEIVAGALQDTKRATLIGETSYGKGTVQTWVELDNNEGGVKLTVAKWLTPLKRWINKTGLTPDIAVTVPANNPVGTDPVLDRAVQFLSSPGAVSWVLPHAA
jgi:carboxyl-terminal processing protease